MSWLKHRTPNQIKIILDGKDEPKTLSLPSVTAIQGNIYIIKAVNINYPIKINPFSSETIDNKNDYSFEEEKEITIIASKDNWIIES